MLIAYIQFRRITWLLLAVLLCSQSTNAQQSLGSLRGKVSDEFGGLIVGANVTLSDRSGAEKKTTTDNDGNYSFQGLAPGRYSLNVVASGFTPFRNDAVEIVAGRNTPLDITVAVAIEQVEVTVAAETPISTETESRAGAIVLRESDLEALPDDPEDLAEALQALAGPSAGLSGGEIYLDGFSGGRLPPKESIREIRLNRNPFSAEYDRLGYGRVEIFTKPGTEKFRGQMFLNFSDESFNSRNPFASVRAPYQSRRYGGNLTGPLKAKRASFFFDLERRELDDNATIRAVILDPALNIVSFNQTLVRPDRRTSVNPRVDYQLNSTNTLIVRYTYLNGRIENSGVGDFNLATRAFNTETTEHNIQATETAVINQKIVNETRIQFTHDRRIQRGLNSLPTLRVSEAFTGGGSQVSLSTNIADRLELQNYTSWSSGNHSLKAGGRLRWTRIKDVSPQNFLGTYSFSGGSGPELPSNLAGCTISGEPAAITLTSIERYRRTLLFLQRGCSAEQIRNLGGGARQFSIAAGNPEAQVSQTDFSPFVQDDWRFRPNVTFSLGLRYEVQTNISDRSSFAPRVAFAWAPGQRAGKPQSTGIRGGAGIFYERFGENLTLQARRFNGVNQQQYVVTNSLPNGTAVLDLFPTIPTIATLSAFSIPQTTRRVANDLRAPYTMQGSISLERQLPRNITLSVTYIAARTLHVLRSRNINAPVPETGVRPFGNIGNIFLYESTGRFTQNQLILNVNSRLSRKINLFANYVFNNASSDTDGVNTFPMNQYDLRGEYGRAATDIRHRLFLGGSINVLPWDLRLSPTLVANAGRPFNITTGRDANGDSLFNERPGFATDLTKPGIIVTRFGAFDPNPVLGQALIPRNYGQGSSFFVINLRISRSFGFGPDAARAGGAARGGGGRGGGGRGAGGGGAFGDSPGTNRRYNLMVSLNVQNLLNHTNLGTPIGNLTSPLFGQANTTSGGFGFGAGGQSAGNRRLDLQLRFSF